MWTRRDWMLAGATAAAVFGMTLALFWTPPLNAGDEKPATSQIATPTYTSGGCLVTASVLAGSQLQSEVEERPIVSSVVPVEDATFVKAGPLPSVQLLVTNPTSGEAHSVFHAELQRSNVRDRLSRVVMVRPPAWSEDFDLSLKAGETRALTLSFDNVQSQDRDTLRLAVGPKPSAPAQPEDRPVVARAWQGVRLVTMVVSTTAEPAFAAGPMRPLK